MKLKLLRLNIFFLKPHQHSRNNKASNWSFPDIKVISACHICHDGKAPWRYTMWPHSSQWCEPSEPRYLFLQDCSTLSSDTRIGDLNELLVHPCCTSLVPDEFWCRFAALCKLYVQHASLQANFTEYNTRRHHKCKIHSASYCNKILQPFFKQNSE